MTPEGTHQATDETTGHWDRRYQDTAVTDVSWFEEEPTTSLELIDAIAPGVGRSVVDVGGGASRLVDHLVARGDEVAVVDLSEVALDRARSRLGPPGPVNWVVADIRTWVPTRRWDVWHDRALLHFLTDPDDRAAYLDVLPQAVGPGGGFVLGVFAEDGPTHCSALPVRRYTGDDLAALVPGATIVEQRRTLHRTPGGATQPFRWLAGRLPDDTTPTPDDHPEDLT